MSLRLLVEKTKKRVLTYEVQIHAERDFNKELENTPKRGNKNTPNGVMNYTPG